MGLGDIPSSEASSNSGPSGNGSSGNSSSTYPKSEKRYPYYAFWEENGELQAGQHPQHVYIEYTKSSENASWKRDVTSHRIKKYWMDEFKFFRVVARVEEEFGVLIPEIAKDDPERACELIRKAAHSDTKDYSVSMTEKCPVCREENHIVHGDWERIDNRRVCTHHTVTELKDAGLIE